MKRKATPKKKSNRAQQSGKPVAKASRARRAPSQQQDGDVVDAMVAAHAQTLGLIIDPAWRDGVKFNLGLILRLAVLVDSFPLADETEPGPIFHA